VVIVVATLSSSNGRPTATPELIARGFAEADELLEELRSQAGSVLEELLAQGILEIKLLQQHLHDDLGQLVYDRTRRRPLILPVVVEV
jgi:ribonuclease J